MTVDNLIISMMHECCYIRYHGRDRCDVMDMVSRCGTDAVMHTDMWIRVADVVQML